nr:MAG TPA: hypothetical protein [Bacteriophage sp.]
MKRYYYKSENRYNASLAHHGIKGMHWGKRNGPPYPLEYSEHTVEQKRKNPKALIDGNENTNPKKSKFKNQNGTKKKSDTRDDLERDKDARMMKSLNPKKTKATKTNNTTKTKTKNDEVHRNTKKILAAVAITAGVGAGIYLAYKYNAVERISDYIHGRSSGDRDGDKVKIDPKSVFPETPLALPPKPHEAILLKDAVKDPNIKKILSESLSEVDTILPAGSVIKRQTGSEDFDLSKTAGKALYTTINEPDAAMYRQLLNDWSGTGKRYEVTMEAVNDIKIPSDVKAISIFNKLWETNPEYKKSIVDEIQKVSGLPRASAQKIVEQDPFSRGMYTLVKGGKDANLFYTELRKEGYNAVRDYFDSPVPGTKMLQDSYISEHATIVLDAVKDLKVTDITKVESVAFGDDTVKTLADMKLIQKSTKSKQIKEIVDDYLRYY